MNASGTVRVALTAITESFSRQQLPELLDELASRRFFGFVQFNFRNGRVVLIRREETTVVTDHRGEDPREYPSTDVTATARR